MDTFNVEGLDRQGGSLLYDCFSKLCRIPFPVEAARADTVMHYEPVNTQPTLMFRCNAAIHESRVNPPNSLRLFGVGTKKYAGVKLNGEDEGEIEQTISLYKEVGFHCQRLTDKLYIVWDERVQGVTE